MVRIRVLVALASLFLLASACESSEHFQESYERAERAIDRAEDAGAEEHAEATLEQAQNTFQDAQRAERRAIEDRDEATRQLRDGERRADAATAALEHRRAELGRAREMREALVKRLGALEVRGNDLRRSGAPDADVDRAIGADIELTRVRLASVEAALDALTRQVEVRELETEDARLQCDAARARLRTAERRFGVAKALFDAAERQARAAEAEALDARRGRLRASMVGT